MTWATPTSPKESSSPTSKESAPSSFPSLSSPTPKVATVVGKIWADAERLGEGSQWMQRSEITTGFVDEALNFIDQTQADQRPIFWRRPPDRPGFGHGFKEDNPDLAVRDGDWKYLINHGGSDPQLYNLPKDPGERQNLEAKHPKIVTRLDKDLRAWNSTMPIDGSDPIFKKVKIRPLKPKR